MANETRCTLGRIQRAGRRDLDCSRLHDIQATATRYRGHLPVWILSPVRAAHSYLRLPRVAKAERRRDRKALRSYDPGIDKCVHETLAWLCRAQDASTSRDGGVARHYSLVTGWSASYPETTGYIIPTMFDCSTAYERNDLRTRAQRMLDWLTTIQFPEGGFQGGLVDSEPIVPVIFNTGQILLGLARAVHESGDQYRPAMRAAANWLVKNQDADGCWRKYESPFAIAGERAYDTHVAWGLLEAARVEPDPTYSGAALKNVRWALGLQRPNGWFANCCLSDSTRPLTHTIGYVLRGIIEAYRFREEPDLLHACRRTANGLLDAMRPDGFLPGRLRSDWRGAVSWSCLTGSAQVAACWLILYQITGDERYRDAAYVANRFLRRTVQIEGPPGLRGGMKGSYPVDGDYGKYELLNWAAKFFIDAQMLERAVRASDAGQPEDQ